MDLNNKAKDILTINNYVNENKKNHLKLIKLRLVTYKICKTNI